MKFSTIGLCLAAFAAPVLVALSAETNSFFPLMAWNSAPSDEATFRKTRECGLTVAGFVSPKELDRRHCQPEFRSVPKQLRMVSPYTGQLGEFAGEHIWLAAGQGVLLKVQ